MAGGTESQLDLAEFNDGFSRLRQYVRADDSRSLLSADDDRGPVLAESLIALPQLLGERTTSVRARAVLRVWQTEIATRLAEGLSMNHLFMLHYLRGNSEKDIQRSVDQTIRVLVVVRALRAAGPRFELTGSMRTSLLDALPILARHVSAEKMWTDEIQRSHVGFLLFNVIDLASAYSGKAKADEAARLLRVEVARIVALYPDMFASFAGLTSYARSLNERLSLNLMLPPLPETLSGKSAGFLALERLERGHPVSPELIEAIRTGGAKHLWWPVLQISRVRSGRAAIYVEPPAPQVDLGRTFDMVWGDPASLASEMISEEEIEYVTSLYDSQVKALLVRIFMNHPRLSAMSRARLPSEAAKGHGGAEISDFDLSFDGPTGPVWVSLPIKTGREAPSLVSEKYTEQVVGQFIRPFERLGIARTCVFPIVLSGLTLNAFEREKTLRSQLGLRLHVIDANTFAKVLKAHGITLRDGRDRNAATH